MCAVTHTIFSPIHCTYRNRIPADSTGNAVRIFVEDTGLGFSAETAERMFGRMAGYSSIFYLGSTG